jgi:hypothetical protein
MAAYSATLRGASRVFVVDNEPDGLALAGRFDATDVNFGEVDPAETVMEPPTGSASTVASRPSATRSTTRPGTCTRADARPAPPAPGVRAGMPPRLQDPVLPESHGPEWTRMLIRFACLNPRSAAAQA